MTLSKQDQQKIQHETLNELLATLDVDVFLSKRQAAAYLSISVSFLERLMSEESLPFYRVKAKVLFRKHEIDSWIEQYWEQGESQDLKKIADEALEAVMKGK